jgi:D-methionine transport system permease protein
MMSMPIVVLAVALFPLTTLILGTCVGRTAAIFPLTLVTTPMFTKFIYDGLLTVNKYMVQAAVSFGASDLQILWIMLKETVPSMISGITISSISVLGVATMMGAIGAGGIGAVAITYGYRFSNYQLIWAIVVILIALTAVIQLIGDTLYKKWR